MNSQKKINLGRGLGKVFFGLSQAQVLEILGSASSIEVIEDSDSGKSEVWLYEDLQLSLTFEEADQFRLGLLSVYSDKYLLGDMIRVGMKQQQVLDILEELNITDYAQEDHSDDDNPNYTLVTIDRKSLFLWFDDEKLVEIEWFPFYDEDEQIIWPS